MPRRPGPIDAEGYELARELRKAGQPLSAIAKATGAAYSTVHRWTNDVRPDLARPAKHSEAIRQSRAIATTTLAAELERGGCRTPGCPNADCGISYGLCHCGCGELAPIARMSERKRGYVRGEPHLFVLGHNRRGFSPGPLSEEGRQVLSETMTAKMKELMGDPQRKAKWAYKRHQSTRLFGRLGGRRPGYTPEERDRVLDLRKRRKSIRTIAAVTGLSKSTVQEICAISKVSGNPP